MEETMLHGQHPVMWGSGHLIVGKIAGLPLHKELQQPDVAEDGSPEEPWRSHRSLLQLGALLGQQTDTHTHTFPKYRLLR